MLFPCQDGRGQCGSAATRLDRSYPGHLRRPPGARRPARCLLWASVLRRRLFGL